MRFWQVDFSYCSHFSTVCSWNHTFHFPHSIWDSIIAQRFTALSALQRGCESRSHRVSMTKSHGLAETHRSELGGFVDDPVGYLVWICLNLTCNVNIEYHFHGHSLAQWRWIMSSWMCLVKFCHVAHLHYAMARRWPGSTPTWQSSLSRYLAWKKRLPGT